MEKLLFCVDWTGLIEKPNGTIELMRRFGKLIVDHQVSSSFAWNVMMATGLAQEKADIHVPDVTFTSEGWIEVMWKLEDYIVELSFREGDLISMIAHNEHKGRASGSFDMHTPDLDSKIADFIQSFH